jgi:DNA-directed RNA polymerase subunit alpha
VFTPIRRVNYRVEKTRVGARTDYDKLLLEIQTDGSIGPQEALAEAAKILIDHFDPFVRLIESGPREPSKQNAIARGDVPRPIIDMPIEVLDLSSRTYNCLKRSQITTVGQILTMSEDELLGLRNFGQKSLQELHEKLAEHGIMTASDGASRRADAGDDDDEDDDIDDNPRDDRPRGGRTTAFSDEKNEDNDEIEEGKFARARGRRRSDFEEEAIDDDDDVR